MQRQKTTEAANAAAHPAAQPASRPAARPAACSRRKGESKNLNGRSMVGRDFCTRCCHAWRRPRRCAEVQSAEQSGAVTLPFARHFCMTTELPRTFKIVTIWLLLGVVVFLALQWWMRQQQQTRFQLQGGVVEIARGPDGHYHWPGSINGRELEFLVDTGATGTAISAQLARELNLPSLGQVQSSTAGGLVTGSVVSVNLTLQGGVRAEQLRVVALEGLNYTRGDRRTEQPLLGMDVLGKLRWQQRDGVLRIELNNTSAEPLR